MTAPSLLEIQLEQAKQLAEEQSQQELEAKVGHHYHHHHDHTIIVIACEGGWQCKPAL